MDFNTFKRNRKQMSESLTKMREEKEEKFKPDDTIYFPKVDSKGNAYAVVRFLPQRDMNKHPIQHIYNHKADINGKKLSILCPSTFGSMKDCDMCMEAGIEWKAQKDSGIEFPKVPEYRKKTSIINVLVVKDKAQPEFEGQVKKMFLANVIVDKINNKLFPPKDDEGNLIRQPEMIHDLWEGKNFNIEIHKNKSGYNDFSDSQFEAESTPVAKTEKEIEDIFNHIFDIEPDRKRLLSNQELREKWDAFHSMNHGESIEEKKKIEVREEIKKKEVEKVEMKKAVEKAEEEFSNTAVEKESSSVDDDDLPW